MKKFEAVLLFSPDLTNQSMKKEDDDFASNIANIGGKIISTEDWGLRDLSYNIDNYQKSFYKYYQLEIESNNISNIKKNLTQNEKILRHLFTKVEKHQKLPTKMMGNEEK